MVVSLTHEDWNLTALKEHLELKADDPLEIVFVTTLEDYARLFQHTRLIVTT